MKDGLIQTRICTVCLQVSTTSSRMHAIDENVIERYISTLKIIQIKCTQTDFIWTMKCM